MIRVIIEREVAEGLEKYYEESIARLLHLMTETPGYISGESLIELHRPNHYFVMTRWTDEAAWQRWFQSEDRAAMVSSIRPFLQTDEKFTLLRQLIYNEKSSAA